MRTATSYRNWLIFTITAALVALPALAGDQPGKDQTKRLQQQLRKAEQEKSQLAQQKTETESQLKEAQGKASDAERQANAASHRNARLNKELEASKAEKEALAIASKADHAALEGKLAETERKLAEQRLERQQLEVALARQKTALSGCSERNARMYEIGNELLDKYEQKGCLSSVLQGEPFTGLKRAQIEKMVEEDREKLDKDQLLPAQGEKVAAPAR